MSRSQVLSNSPKLFEGSSQHSDVHRARTLMDSGQEIGACNWSQTALKVQRRCPLPNSVRWGCGCWAHQLVPVTQR